MPPSKKGRSVWRVLVAVAVAIATVVTMILVGNQLALADVWWGSGRF
jgi:low affinity Fe/Cu permease